MPPLSDDALKTREASLRLAGGSTRPGAVSVAPSSAQGQKIAKKNEAANEPTTTAGFQNEEAGGLMLAPPSTTYDMDRKPSAIQGLSSTDARAKQQGRNTPPATMPGAAAAATPRSQESLESDLYAKTRGDHGLATAPGVVAVHPDMDVKLTSSAESGMMVGAVSVVGFNSEEKKVTEKTASLGIAPATSSRPQTPDVHGKKSTDGTLNVKASPMKAASMRGDFVKGTYPPEQALSKSQSGRITAAEAAPDVEFGFGTLNEDGVGGKEGLAVAMPVDADEEDAYIQAAVEFDPDAKPAMYMRRRFRLYALLVIFGFMAAAIGAILGVVLTQGGNRNAKGRDIPYRETLGIRSRAENLVGKEKLDDPNSPYAKALAWITHNDTMELLPDASNFVQRYILAYLYYATTVDGKWRSCNPLPHNESQDCVHGVMAGISPIAYVNGSSTRWLGPLNECRWPGVVCDNPDGGEVRNLEMSGQWLSGPFPEGLKYMLSLQSVHLSWNALRGTIPADFLVDLNYLISAQLVANELTGTVPDSWWGASDLTRLNLGFNRFNGTISSSVRNMRAMRGLYLQDNLFEGTLPTEFGALTTLNSFHIHKNMLTGPFPSEMSNMAGLEDLYLHKNSLTGSLPDNIGKLSALAEFRLQSNSGFGGELPDSFYDLNLWRLDLRDCNFTGSLSPKIGSMKLESLRLANNRFSGPLPPEMKNLTKLVELQIQGTDLTGDIPTEMCDLDFQILTADCKEQGTFPGEVVCVCCTSCCDPKGLDCT